MKRFSKLRVEHVRRLKRKLTSDFTYTDKKWGKITVPTGFVTDLASIEKLRAIPWVYTMLAKYGDRSAVIHDWLYYNKPVLNKSKTERLRISRAKADKIFYRALRAEGIARWRAGMFYLGVRAFGSKGWHKAR